MPKIKRNNKLIHYNRVVAYGCSFTVGEETADTFVRPGLTLDQIDDEKRSMGMEAWLFKYLTPNKANSPQRKREANSNSWANQLAAMLGVPCVNNSRSGNSMECMIYEIEKDLFTGKITENDLILVGCTSMTRYFWIDEKLELKRLLLNYHLDEWPSKELHDEFLKGANDYFLFYKYALCMRHLDLLSKSIDGRLLLFNCHFNLIGNIGNSPKVKSSSEFSDLIMHLAINNSFLDEGYSFNKILDWYKDTHGGMHPKRHHHTQFAEHFYNLMKCDE